MVAVLPWSEQLGTVLWKSIISPSRMTEWSGAMSTRRTFMRRLLSSLFGVGLLPSPWWPAVKNALGRTHKMVAPPGTLAEELLGQDPKDLDTSHLNVTPLDEFGTMGLDDHEVALDRWSLRVEGSVSKVISLTYAELLEFPAFEKAVLLICPGVFVNHGLWKGFSVKHLLQLAGAYHNVTYVTFRGPMGPYEKVARTPLEEVLADRVFLAYQVNGVPLPRKHGFPVRLVAEGYYGYDWVKYVDRVTADAIH
jgi:DMSO/TMAO reductase YedYZ molybdopterin-dependent catalytic subunit